MKKVILTAIVAFSALAFLGCSSKDNKLADNSRTITAAPINKPDTVLAKWQKERQIASQNKAISRTLEIPTGRENFDKIVAYIWKYGFMITGPNGFMITGEPKRIACGKQYTFYDSKGNGHICLAIKIDAVTKQASMTGKVQNVFVYGYNKGSRGQKYIFSYDITAERVIGPMKNVDEATFGYKKLLAEANRQ